MRGRTTALAGLAALALLAACKEELHTGLSEAEANEIVSVLTRAGAEASRTLGGDGTATVLVESADFGRAVEVLKSQGYPKRAYLTLGDVFQGDGFVVSQMEERARFVFAMTEELSRTIAEIDGVLGARVHVVLPTSDPMSRSRAASSASVAIRHLAAADTEDLLPQIKMLVANSIEGLSYDKVSVVFIPVAASAGPPPPPAEGAARGPLAALAASGAGWIGAAGGAAGGALLMLLLGLGRGRRPPPPPRKVEVMPAE